MNTKTRIKCQFTIILTAILICVSANAQTKKGSIPKQDVRGTVMDQVLQTPLAGATVSLPQLNKQTITDANGIFYFSNIPIGVLQVQATHTGYKEVNIYNINVNAGKETVLSINMENTIQQADAVVIQTSGKRNKPLNEMSMVSARAFTVEETQKYAAAVNDPSRMATGFPGVITTDDGNNNIVIRGNSPTGLLWRMEGIDIPNPNHFSSTGSSGGGISILSTQLLANSDFITSAFAPEYGNALSGVFDLRLRKGNNQKHEYALQAGVLGLNAAIEGPFTKGYSGSYLVNYRYSTLQLLDKLGVTLNTGATNFQDLSYNIYLPTKRLGNFTLFGFGGLSNQDEKAEQDSTKWDDKGKRYVSQFVSNTGMSGITHTLSLGSQTMLRTALAYSYNKITDNFQYVQDNLSLREDYIDDYRTRKLTATTTLNHKFNRRSTLRSGAIINLINFDYFQKSREGDYDPIKEVINVRGRTQTLQGFAEWQYKAKPHLTIDGGVHYLQLMYNKSHAIEPRAAVKWDDGNRNSMAVGYGLHSQIQALGAYFAEVKNAQGMMQYPNKDLKLTQAHHFVLSWQHAFNRNLSFKAEAYYQHLFHVPISTSDTSTLSALNIASEYITDPLVNKGKGRNYGVELSLERYLDNYFYCTMSTSLYRSLYSAADGIERSTRFDGRYLANMVAGKEFVSDNKIRTFGINIKSIYAGGLRTTPIDQEASVQQGKAVYREKEAFTQQNPAYFRTDIRLSMKWNRKHLTSTLSLDIQNVTNRQNVYGQRFDSYKGKVVTTFQNGLIPILNYKVEF